MKRFSTLLLTLLLTGGLVLVGCDSNSSDDGSMTMKMTESSSSTSSKLASKSHVGDLQKAEMVVSDVTVAPENSEDDETSVLTTENFTVDLKSLNSGLEENIDDFSIPVNPDEGYGQIRLKTGSEAVKLTLKDGTEKTARVASNEIKLNFSPGFTVDSPDDRVEVTVDWDVEESLKGREAGSDLSQSNLVITPVVQATATVTSATDDSDDSSGDDSTN